MIRFQVRVDVDGNPLRGLTFRASVGNAGPSEPEPRVVLAPGREKTALLAKFFKALRDRTRGAVRP